MEVTRLAECMNLIFQWVFPQPPGGKSREEFLLDAMEFVILAVASGVEETAKWQAPRLAADPEAWGTWVEVSKHDPLAWQTVQLAARAVWEEAPDVLLRSVLGTWAVEAGVGIRSKPSVSGPDPWKPLVRDAAIVGTIKRIVALGQRPATSTTAGRSACHKVAERFASSPKDYGVRVPQSYDGVRRIWQNRCQSET